MGSSRSSRSEDRNPPSEAADKPQNDIDHKSTASEAALSAELISAGSQNLQRRIGGKEVQLFAVGGAIGTCKNALLNCSVYALVDPQQANAPRFISTFCANGCVITKRRAGWPFSGVCIVRDDHARGESMFR